MTRGTPQHNDFLRGWRNHLDQFRAGIEELNKLIADTSPRQPDEKLEILKPASGVGLR